MNQHKIVTESTHKFTAEDLHNVLGNTNSTINNPNDTDDLTDDG